MTRSAATWASLTAFALVFAAHHLYRVAELYVVAAGRGVWAAVAGAVAVFAGLVAPVLFDRTGVKSETRVPFLLVACAWCSLGASAVPFRFFSSGSLAHGSAMTLTALGAFVVAATVLDVYRTVVRPLLESHGFSVPSPLRLAIWISLSLVAFIAAARIGVLRTGFASAGLLAAAAASFPGIHSLFGIGAAATTGVAVAAGFAVAGEWVPMRVVRAFPDEVVYAKSTEAHDYAVVASPGGYELYGDSQLLVSALDEARSTAALVEPVLSIHPNATQVLLVFGGTGVFEREILKDARVKELTVLTADAELPAMARGLQWLDARSAAALSSPRVHVVSTEPVAWLASNDRRFDVIVANLPAPTGFREGKYYTRYFYELMASRLRDGGVFVTTAASAFAAPSAFASVRSTIESAGLRTLAYHADVPSLGIASYVMASREPLPDVVVAPNAALDFGRDLDTGAGVVSTLYDQRVVAAFQERLGSNAF